MVGVVVAAAALGYGVARSGYVVVATGRPWSSLTTRWVSELSSHEKTSADWLLVTLAGTRVVA